ncbi:solute carrier family 2 member 9, like 1 [Sphaeramia orbicularis]|uniref:solute carrier family 2 member 9, like 1 n=1 Tax=Sphaeramia orbicularis TaxID=375764 RepID=UPI001180D1E8|nr:solute carrier family 2, facilitated glucose transporter member 9-like [Sphaeramia orbicularis]
MIWSLIVSMYAIGGLFGAISVRYMSGMFGRKKVMICNSFVAIVAAGFMLTSKRLKSFEMVIVGRFLNGISSGLGGTIHIMYLGEISPRKIRGLVTLTYTTFLSFGKVSGQFFGLSEILGREELWELILCVPAVFAVLQVLLLPFFPEAPRYLFIEKSDDVACKKALQTLWGSGDYKMEMDEMLVEQAALEVAPPKSLAQLLRNRSVRWQLVTMSFIYCCNMMSGMAVISTFAFDIFLNSGIPRDKIRYVTLGLGVSEIVTSIFCGLLIEHIGRRPLFFCGYGVMSASWVLVTVTMNLKDFIWWAPYCTMALIIVFIIFFGGGPGGATNTLNTEIFIQSDRMASLVIMGIMRWSLFATLGMIFPFLLDAFGSYCFVLFACVCLLGCIYTFFLVPETKGKTLLEISEEFQRITVCGKSFAEEKKVETRL